MNAIAKLDIVSARATITRLVPEFTRALPPGVDPQRFARVVQTALQQNDKLMECSPDSLWGACMKAAQDGLLPDGREGAIVPRWNGKAKRLDAHWMPMVYGLIAKAKRKGSVVSLSAQVVYSGEEFQVLMGDEDRIVHRRDVTKVQRGHEIAVYAIATMKDGSKEREVMSWDQVQQVAAVSADKEGNETGVWRTWPEEMARKSCIRRLSKRLPSLDDGDDDLRQTIERVDELYDFGKPALAAPPISLDAPDHTDIGSVSRQIDTNEPERTPKQIYADLEADAETPGTAAPYQPAKPTLERFRAHIATLTTIKQCVTLIDVKALARPDFDSMSAGEQAEVRELLRLRAEAIGAAETPDAGDVVEDYKIKGADDIEVPGAERLAG